MAFAFSTPIQRLDVVEKILSVLVAAPLLFMFDLDTALGIYLAGSFAHTILAHVYQIRAGKVDRFWVSLFFATVCVFYLIAYSWPVPFIMLAFSLTFIHVVTDEIHLSRQQTTASRYFLGFAIACILIIQSNMTKETMFGYAPHMDPVLANTLLTAAFAISGLLLIRCLMARDGIGPFEVYMTGFYLFIAGIHVFGIDIHPFRIFFFFSILHFMNWYVRVFDRIYKTQSRKKLAAYIVDVVMANAFAAFLYLLNMLMGPGTILSTYLIDIRAAAVWAMIHSLFTIRPGNYANVWRGMQGAILPLLKRG